VRFVKESTIRATPREVFAFHESPGALERLTPPWETVERIEGGESIRPGSQVVMRVKSGPFWLRWVAEHTEYEAGRLFADRQVRGPFARWYHRHLFLDGGTGCTTLQDEVEYEPPFGWLGRRLAGRFLEEKLHRLFEYRHETTRRILESDGPADVGIAAPDRGGVHS